jgi:hypothetical protein
MAKRASMENRYTKIGTVRMEPPLPINPNDKPIKKAPAYPAISILWFDNGQLDRFTNLQQLFF